MQRLWQQRQTLLLLCGLRKLPPHRSDRPLLRLRLLQLRCRLQRAPLLRTKPLRLLHRLLQLLLLPLPLRLQLSQHLCQYLPQPPRLLLQPLVHLHLPP
jgi:hypothetical protein